MELIVVYVSCIYCAISTCAYLFKAQNSWKAGRVLGLFVVTESVRVDEETLLTKVCCQIILFSVFCLFVFWFILFVC